MIQLCPLHTFLLHSCIPWHFYNLFSKGNSSSVFVWLQVSLKRSLHFFSLLAPHLSIATSTVGRRFVVTLSRLLICGNTNSSARLCRNNLHCGSFLLQIPSFVLKRQQIHLVEQHPANCATSLLAIFLSAACSYMCECWSKVSISALVPL